MWEHLGAKYQKISEASLLRLVLEAALSRHKRKLSKADGASAPLRKKHVIANVNINWKNMEKYSKCTYGCIWGNHVPHFSTYLSRMVPDGACCCIVFGAERTGPNMIKHGPCFTHIRMKQEASRCCHVLPSFPRSLHESRQSP